MRLLVVTVALFLGLQCSGSAQSTASLLKVETWKFPAEFASIYKVATHKVDFDRREATINFVLLLDHEDRSEVTRYMIAPTIIAFYDKGEQKLATIKTQWLTIPPGGRKGENVRLHFELPSNKVLKASTSVVVR